MMVTLDMYKNLFYQIIFFALFSQCYSNDILGCGGFVKSHVSLDYSKIEIGLYTKEGSLKEKTECAPTNGYYFLPLYEHGEYVLKIHPPAGWSFEPSQVELSIDGVTDRCSTGHDIDFSFNGFGITGRVITAGQTQGPSGIAVQLINDNGEVRNTITTYEGDFHFTPVIPGKYTVKASHAKWTLEPAQAVVQVKEGNTALPVGVLAVRGYEVTGLITSFGGPIGGIYVLLYSKEENPKFRVEGCKTALLQGVPDSPICYSVTDESGEFHFGLVPAGDYKLLALSKPPGQGFISYNIKPEAVTFNVKHDNIYVKNAFEVTGFNLVGSVLTSPGGSGIAGVRVLSDGTPIGTTDATGTFAMPSLKPAIYTLTFQHEQCEVDDLQLTVGASGPVGSPRTVAARWRVCGSVSPPERRRVLLVGGRTKTPHHATSDDNGKWCTFLPSGKYTAKVEVSEQEIRDGLQWYPESVPVAVGHAAVEGVSFSQLRARVAGRVQCASPQCAGLLVQLRPLSADGNYQGTVRTIAIDSKGEYEFSEVVPGSVEVSVGTTRLCWAEARYNVAVAAERAVVPTFQHTGYAITLHTDYDIEVEYKSKSSQGVLKVVAGENQQCLPAAEPYTLTVRGCHRMQPAEARVDTSADAAQEVRFEAVAHAAVVAVTSPDPVSDLVLTVVVGTEGAEQRVGPLRPEPHDDGGYIYQHTLYLADGDVVTVSAHSASLLVGGRGGPQRVVGGRECRVRPAALTLRAARALTLAGRVDPPVAGVTLTLHSDEEVIGSQVTGADGAYSFGPLDASRRYAIAAEKDSYVFGERGDGGVIAAHKLAEIHARLLDAADGAPLEGALVSVSGGQYRRNVASPADGSLRFASLPPAQYYVKPNMKEYRFEPQHSIVAVADGSVHSLVFRGSRVAWSASGRVVSLGGAGRGGVAVRARPRPLSDHCAAHDATAAPDGSFRIRGLQPNCVYTIELKDTPSSEQGGLKLAKAPPTVEVKEKDIENVNLIVIERHQVTDSSVLVYTPNVEHYRTLRLTLVAESSDAPLYNVRLDPAGCGPANPGLMYAPPRLPADNRTYILSLESTLSKASHLYEEETIYFTSDGRYKAFRIEFLPKVRTSEQEVGAASALVVLMGVVALVILQRERLMQLITTSLAKRQPRRKQH